MPLETTNLLRSVIQPHRDKKLFIALAAEITRWEEVIESARYHGVLPMLYSKLQGLEEVIPSNAMDLARSEYERNAFHCIANAAELLAVLGEFTANGIAAMPFKGVALAASAYKDLTARAAGDLDLLIYRQDLHQATDILKQRGYELKTNVLEDGSPEGTDCFEFHFERPTDGLVLELRWRLELTRHLRRDFGMTWVWPQHRMADLAGAQIPNLDPVSALLVLCMHGSKHGWRRLIWICDVAKLIESEPKLDWDFARWEARRVGLFRCLALGVLLANRCAGAQVPPDVLRELSEDRRARTIAEFLDNHVAQEPGRMPDGLIPYNIRLLDFRDRARAVLSPGFLRPRERDRAFIKLPKALDPLYFLIRPLRLLLDRSGR
jgi:hypothetical protein